jgi:hypothetical protein
MEKLLRPFTKHHLVNFAKALAQKKGIQVDRLAVRQKICLICWFCENCPELLTEITCPQRLCPTEPPPESSTNVEWEDPDCEAD